MTKVKDNPIIDRRSFLKYSGLLLTSISLSSCTELAGRRKANEPFFFIHMADPQLFWGPLKLWQQSIASANRLKPSFVVVGGDLINNDGKSKNHDFTKDVKMTQAYLKTAKTLNANIPLYNVAGNHDVCNVPTHQTLQWYEKTFGKLWYSFKHNRSLFIVLESDVLKNPQNAPDMKEKQMVWLKETLQKSEKETTRHKIVFMHHPMCLKDAKEKNQYFNMPKEIRNELLELFHRYNVKAVFSGHYHQNVYVNDNGLELVTTASCGKALGKDPIGFRVVKVFPDRIEHQYHALDKLPANISL